MARPVKKRNVCALPAYGTFGAMGTGAKKRGTIVMTVDEYEAIHLMDYEGMNQTEAADKMEVARTSAQRIYHEAKQKLADALVNGKLLVIEGGSFQLCERGGSCRGGMGCRRRAGFPKE